MFKGTYILNRFIVTPPNYKSLHLNSYSSSLANNNNGRSAYVYDDNVNDALKSFDVMIHQRPVPSVVRFTGLLHHVVTQLKHYSCSLDLFKQICAFGFPVNKYTSGIAVKCYCRLRRSKHGLTVMGFCFKQGVEPHVSICNTLLKGFIREQMTYEAEHLFRLMNRRQLCEPNLATYKIIIEGLGKVGSHYAATGLLRVLHHRRLKVDVVAYNMIFDSLCKDVVVIDDVFKLFKEMVRHKDITPNVHTYNSLIYNLSKLGRWDEVGKILKQMEEANICPEVKTFNIIVDALCKKLKITEADIVIKIMEETDGKYCPDIVTYNSLIEAYGWSYDMWEARRVFDSLASKNIKPNSVTYNKMMLGYILDANVYKFLEFYNMSYDGRLDDSVWFFTCTNFYIERLMLGKYKDAIALFHLMDGHGVNFNVDAHITLIRRAIRRRKFDDARRLFHDLLYADIRPPQCKREAIAFKVQHGDLDRVSRHLIVFMTPTLAHMSTPNLDLFIMERTVRLTEKLLTSTQLVENVTRST
uniref:putative pentatricopeptide repeat-containing protein At1g12700, mitochondrial n=1 Tax=Erigeron canadensis TaxID=72917 RepID=UPI001CB9471B|nr:putative pentatricopeptide repeat-containing protein At1g12700, mitochondrial [Erigeron canadensis]